MKYAENMNDKYSVQKFTSMSTSGVDCGPDLLTTMMVEACHPRPHVAASSGTRRGTARGSAPKASTEGFFL